MKNLTSAINEELISIIREFNLERSDPDEYYGIGEGFSVEWKIKVEDAINLIESCIPNDENLLALVKERFNENQKLMEDNQMLREQIALLNHAIRLLQNEKEELQKMSQINECDNTIV